MGYIVHNPALVIPFDPSNGIINCSLGDNGVPDPSEICVYTCYTGYMLTGSNARTCQSNGSWVS